MADNSKKGEVARCAEEIPFILANQQKDPNSS